LPFITEKREREKLNINWALGWKIAKGRYEKINKQAYWYAKLTDWMIKWRSERVSGWVTYLQKKTKQSMKKTQVIQSFNDPISYLIDELIDKGKNVKQTESCIYIFREIP